LPEIKFAHFRLKTNTRTNVKVAWPLNGKTTPDMPGNSSNKAFLLSF
jgi:hypothetical protein